MWPVIHLFVVAAAAATTITVIDKEIHATVNSSSIIFNVNMT